MLNSEGVLDIDHDVLEAMRQRKGLAAIIAGSDSDEPHIKTLCENLDRYNISHTAGIASGHKMPGFLHQIVTEGFNKIWGSATLITCAGGLDALSGTVSFLSMNLVISSPPNKDPTDKTRYALNDTCLRNPTGSSNIYIRNPAAVARFIAQQYAGVNPELREYLTVEETAPTSIDDAFKQAMCFNTGCVTVLCFSNATATAQAVASALGKYEVPYTVREFKPEVTTRMIREFVRENNCIGGTMVYITTDSFFDYVTQQSFHPTISVIRDQSQATDEHVAYVMKPENAARAAAQMFAGFNPDIWAALETTTEAKIRSLVQANDVFRKTYTKIR